MPEQILAKLDAIQTTIASLRAELGGLHAQVSTKADGTAVSSLTNTVTAQGSSITTLSSRIASSCDCSKAAATAESALDTTRIQTHSAFIIVGGRVYINEAALESAFIRTEVSARAKADAAIASAERFSIDDGVANTIRQVIRDELKPGGMLHRG